jgi:hypothetical protein
MFLWFNLVALCHSQDSLMFSTDIDFTETTYSCQILIRLVINKCVTAAKVLNISGHYHRNRSNLDLYRYTLTIGTPSRSLAISPWTLYIFS